MDDARIEAYWSTFLETLPADSPVRDEPYVAEGWGDSPRLADELGALIAAGTKTATCSALWEYEAEGRSMRDSPTRRERVPVRWSTGGRRTGASSRVRCPR